MDFELLFVQSQKTAWVEAAVAVFAEKIGHSLRFKVTPIKSKRLDRDDSAEKVRQESEALMKALGEGDFVILFDESGKSMGSLDFSRELGALRDRGAKRIKFVIGGAFGVSDSFKKRSNWKVSLSNMTMNHQVAIVVALEQIYRATQIWGGRPYHNE